MATSEHIRNRIIEVVKNNQFSIDDLLQVFSQLVHEGELENKDIIKIVQYLHNDILNAQTKASHRKQINPITGKNYSYNSHQFMKGERYTLSDIEFITDNK